VFSLWNLDRQLVPEPVRETDLRVGVLIPTYNEPMEVLFPTVAAAVALEPSHETYVLDDGQRLWVRAMAASLGARYIARKEHTYAKAGNVNHALAQLELDVVGILDADHVADSGFLTNTLGYFEDHHVAVVQTPRTSTTWTHSSMTGTARGSGVRGDRSRSTSSGSSTGRSNRARTAGRPRSGVGQTPS
jgi:cellulose synthase (UDP-forming)